MNPNSPTQPLFSVVIPTYNRASLLAGALESLLGQTFDPRRYEIIVVDNGSSDETRTRVENMQAGCAPYTIRYIHEPRPGGGIARYDGAIAARGTWIAFMDDDAKASTDWLQTAAQIVQAQPDLAGMGGPIHPFYLASRPGWFLDEYEIRTWGDVPRLLERGEAFAGANMFFPRALLEKLSPAMQGFGMLGEFMQFGEDTILFERSWDILGQPRFFYHPDLIVYHAVPARNMDTGYILRRQFSIGAGNFKRTGPKSLLPRVGFIIHHTASMLRLGVQMLIRSGKYARKENWLVDYGGPVAKKLGFLSTALGLRIQFRQRQSTSNEAKS